MIKYFNLALSTFLLVSPAYSAGKGLPQLDFTTYPSLIFWSILSLLSLYLVMSYVISPVISEGLGGGGGRVRCPGHAPRVLHGHKLHRPTSTTAMALRTCPLATRMASPMGCKCSHTLLPAIMVACLAISFSG